VYIEYSRVTPFFNLYFAAVEVYVDAIKNRCERHGAVSPKLINLVASGFPLAALIRLYKLLKNNSRLF
jgi:hypothetical protein